MFCQYGRDCLQTRRVRLLSGGGHAKKQTCVLPEGCGIRYSVWPADRLQRVPPNMWS